MMSTRLRDLRQREDAKVHTTPRGGTCGCTSLAAVRTARRRAGGLAAVGVRRGSGAGGWGNAAEDAVRLVAESGGVKQGGQRLIGVTVTKYQRPQTWNGYSLTVVDRERAH